MPYAPHCNIEGMGEIKILWLSNRFLGNDNGTTGTWLIALAERMPQLKDIKLVNITIGKSKRIAQFNNSKIEQWLIPLSGLKRNGLPKKKCREKIRKLIEDISPSLIHVWGVENFWGTITADMQHKIPVLLEIQGLKWTIAPKFYGELTLTQRLQTINFKEILKMRNMFFEKHKYEFWGTIEQWIIRNHHHISTHSTWAEANVFAINPGCIMYKNQRMLRKEFTEAKSWVYNGQDVIFTSLSYITPFKGLYTVIKSLEIIKSLIPEIKLLIVGNIRVTGLRTDGYVKFLKREIKKRKLQDNIEWAGGMNAEMLVQQLKKVSLSIFPSFVESYGLALAESMALGVPCVASYNGGYGYLGEDEKNVLFFPAGDHAFCAFQIFRLLKSRILQEELSRNSIGFIKMNNDPKYILDQQINIYNNILKR
jgi:glycosyltransferase involved in cell wall biosynthesis